jgi:hypothetical protein
MHFFGFLLNIIREYLDWTRAPLARFEVLKRFEKNKNEDSCWTVLRTVSGHL